MTVVTERNFDDVVSPDMVEEYWYRVRRALRDVIGRPADLVDGYRASRAARHDSDRAWLYRDDPLQLATDLSGHDLTPENADRYAQLFPEPIAPGQPAWSLP